MTTIISLSAFRNGKLKDRLITHALNGEAVVIETATGFITARKVICRNAVVEILNACGDYFVIAYEDICNVRLAQAHALLAPAQWSESFSLCSSSARVLPFRGRGLRRRRRKS